MSNDAPERSNSFRLEWSRREASRIAAIAEERHDRIKVQIERIEDLVSQVDTARARIAELEAALLAEVRKLDDQANAARKWRVALEWIADGAALDPADFARRALEAKP